MSDPAASLSAEQAIAALIVDIGDALDTYDERRIGEYLRYASWHIEATGNVFEGTEGAEELIYRFVRHHEHLPATQHDITNVLVEVGAGAQTATARSEFAVVQATPELPLQFIMAGHYDDTFERRQGLWRLVDRREHWDLVGDLSQHLANPDHAKVSSER